MDDKSIASAESQDLLGQLEERVAAIAESLPSELPSAEIGGAWSSTFSALSAREVLMRRGLDLASSVATSLRAKQYVAAVLLCRAVLETAAALFHLLKSIENSVENSDAGQLSEKSLQLLFGSRWEEPIVSATNILTLVGKVDKVHPGFRATYDQLSEIAHPNLDGLLGSYGTLEGDPPILALGEGPYIPNAARVALDMTLSGLDFCLHDYNRFAEYWQSVIDNERARAKDSGESLDA